MDFTIDLALEYISLYKTILFRKDKIFVIDFLIKKIMENKHRYEEVSTLTGVPWYIVSAIHCLEANLDFEKHLHNGDPLTDRTKRVPIGRPKKGTPPFTWLESAVDSIKHERLDEGEWNLARALYRLESYNGMGYRNHHPEVLTPYLWSFSTHYNKGKYVADRSWSPEAISNQCGAAVLLKRMEDKKIIKIPIEQPHFRYADQVIPYAIELQKFLNNFITDKIEADGWPGKKTSDAFKKLTGYYLAGDPRKN